MKIREYLKQHLITGTYHPNYVCVDAIVDDPERFIGLLMESNYYIEEIIMWDRVCIGVGSNIGYGGPPDPRDIQKYYFSETFLSKVFDVSANYDEYMHFISKCVSDYPQNHLHPSFTIVHRKP